MSPGASFPSTTKCRSAFEWAATRRGRHGTAGWLAEKRGCRHSLPVRRSAGGRLICAFYSFNLGLPQDLGGGSRRRVTIPQLAELGEGGPSPLSEPVLERLDAPALSGIVRSGGKVRAAYGYRLVRCRL